MKKLILAVLLFSPLPAVADSDYFLTWSIGTGLSDPKFKTLELELISLKKYFNANGALVDSNGGHLPVSGTCFLLRSNSVNTGVSCTVDTAGFSYRLNTDMSLAGSLTERDVLGSITGSAAVTLISGE